MAQDLARNADFMKVRVALPNGRLSPEHVLMRCWIHFTSVHICVRSVHLGRVSPAAYVSSCLPIWAQVPLLDIPANFIPDVARNIVKVQRLVVSAQLVGAPESQVESLVSALTHAVHSDASWRDNDNNLHITDLMLSDALNAADFDPSTAESVISALGTQAVKDGLAGNTAAAVAAGAFGSPFMVITGGRAPHEEFTAFGSDRFEAIAWACGKPWDGPGGPRRGGLL